MGASVRIHCFYSEEINISGIMEQCWRKVENVQLQMNVHSKTSDGDLSRLNASGVEGVRVNDDVYKVIKESIKYSQVTCGAYDITVYPLIELWKNASQEGRLPDCKELETVKGKVGYENIRLQGPNIVFLKKSGMKLDLGSPASGFVCDAIAGILDANKVRHYLVDGGGEIFCRGLDQGQKPWIIGVQDPFNKDNLHSYIELKDRGVSTSGNYEKFYTIGSERFSHIIDPISGWPQKNAVSVTVIAKTTQVANELSTALSVLGGEKGMRLVRSLKNVEALVIENKDGKLVQYKTPGFR